jgi:hypothetical protein
MAVQYYGMAVKYCSISNLEKTIFKITAVIYRGIFIALASGTFTPVYFPKVFMTV